MRDQNSIGDSERRRNTATDVERIADALERIADALEKESK